jgi:hypothetical protein
MFTPEQVAQVQKANEFIKSNLPMVKAVHPTFEKKRLVCLIKMKDLDCEVAERVKKEIHKDRTFLYVKFLKDFSIECSYNKIDFTKLPKSEPCGSYFVTDSMLNVTEIEDEETDVATLKKGFNAVIQQLNAIDQIINSPDLVHFKTEIDNTYEEERKLKAQLKALDEKRTLLYRKKKDCYKKVWTIYTFLVWYDEFFVKI